MGLFKKKRKVIDLTDRLRRQQEKLDAMREDIEQSRTPEPAAQKEPTGGSFFSFLGNSSSRSSNETKTTDYSSSEDSEDKKKKLAKRLSDITTRLEDLSNSIYKIEQRLELIERKMNLGRY